MAKTVKDSAATRKVAILAADGVDGEAVAAMQRALLAAGAVPKIVAPRGGSLKPEGGGTLPVDFSLLTVGSVLFVREAYKHCKAIAASGTGVALVEAAGVDTKDVLTRRDADGQLAAAFVKAIARHRDWSREAKARTVPA
jgi:catalase